MMSLAPFGRLNDIRKNKAALFASLSELEVEILDKVAAGGSCFGDKETTAVVLSTSNRHNSRVLENSRIVGAMVRAGWLRFVESPVVKGSGHFWMTSSAERVWKELGRRVF